MKKELIKRNEENLSQVYKEIARVGEGTLHQSQNFNWVNCYPSSWPNTIFGTNREKADFALITNGIRKGVIPAFWIQLREDDLEACNAHFGLHGFRHLAAWTGMCLALDSLPTLDLTCKAHLQQISQEEELKNWVEVANKTLFKTKPIDENLLKKIYQFSDQIRFYAAKVEGQIVSIAMSFSNKKTVGIYAVSTLEEYRNQGISSALTHYALLEAKMKACDLATLQATKMGEGVYRNLGFKTYGFFDVYWLLA